MIAVGYKSLTDTQMYELAGTWRDLRAILSQHRETSSKFAGALWSPVIPSPDGPGRRCNIAIVALSAVVLDIDDGTPLEAATADLTGEWIAYSTWNHHPDRPRYHVVMRLPVPVPARDWAATYERLNGHHADWLPAVSHAYFLPEHGHGAQWFVRYS